MNAAARRPSGGIDALLARLEGVQKSAVGYRARCPACGGQSRKVSISEGDDGRVLVHGFCGCSAAEIVQAAGLSLADLFPERLAADTPEERRRRQRLARESQWGAALDVLEFEARVLLIAARDVVAGRPLDRDDYQRLCAAMDRIEGARCVLRDQPRWQPAHPEVRTWH